MLRSRSTAPKPSWRSGRWRASMSTPPDEHRGHQEERHQPGGRQVAGQDQRDAEHADGGQGAVEESAAAAGDLDLDREHGVEGAVHDRGEVGVAAQHVGLAQRRAEVVAGGDALLGRGGVVGPGGLLDHLLQRDLRQEASHDEVGGGRGEREQEDRGPPRQAGDHPERAGGEEGARGLPHAPAHQLADLPGVVVDPVEDLADGLLGQLRERLCHRGVEEVGAQLTLGAVADRGPDGLGDGVDDRTADHARTQQPQEHLGRPVRQPAGDHRRRARRRWRRPATSRSRGRSADDAPGASRPADGAREDPARSSSGVLRGRGR